MRRRGERDERTARRAARRDKTLTRTDITFDSGGTTCAAWHYRAAGLPEGRPRGCVVLAHGFTMVRDAGLDAYAERFRAEGIDCLVFDYRCCGKSAGEPREWLDVSRQLEDWRAAIACARSLPDIDPARIGLWGTSFSGGHVAAVAAEDPAIAAVVSQAPFSGLGGRREVPGAPPARPRHLARLVFAGLRDAARGRMGRAPAYIPVVAEPPAFAAFDLPGAREQIDILVGGSTTWVNRFTPRVVLQMGRYRPFARAADIRCPWLLDVCDPDTVTPAAAAVRRAAGAPQLTVRRRPFAHFEIYTGAAFDEMAGEQATFLRAHLGG